jgi:hypothetical protein
VYAAIPYHCLATREPAEKVPLPIQTDRYGTKSEVDRRSNCAMDRECRLSDPALVVVENDRAHMYPLLMVNPGMLVYATAHAKNEQEQGTSFWN